MRILANGIWLEYDTFGDQEAKPLLLISGLNTPMTRWTDEFCKQLASYGFLVIRYDNRDCGLSQYLDEFVAPSAIKMTCALMLGIRIRVPYTLFDLVNDAIALLDGLGIRKAHVAGRSMGGMIAQLMAAVYPERVTRLSLIMTSTGNRLRSFPKLRVLKFLLRRKPNPQNDLAAYLQYRVQYTRTIGSAKYPQDDFFIRSRVMADIKRAGFQPGAAQRQFAALLAAGDITEFTRRINVPTTVIHGNTDPLVPLEAGLHVHRNIQNARLLVIENMGHALQPPFYQEILSAILDPGVLPNKVH